MDKLCLIARILLGLMFLVFGFNYFFQFMSMPPMPEAAGNFMGALAATGYFFPFLKIVEIICGLLLLIGIFVPLALLMLAPVVLNIVLFHLFLAPGGTLFGLIALVLGCFVAWCYRSSFRGVLQAKAGTG